MDDSDSHKQVVHEEQEICYEVHGDQVQVGDVDEEDHVLVYDNDEDVLNEVDCNHHSDEPLDYDGDDQEDEDQEDIQEVEYGVVHPYE